MGQSKLLIVTVVGAAICLGGCAGGLKPSLDQIEPICKALIGPIKYNTYVHSSKRYAGSQLAPDLKAHNQVGQWLGCPAYRR